MSITCKFYYRASFQGRCRGTDSFADLGLAWKTDNHCKRSYSTREPLENPTSRCFCRRLFPFEPFPFFGRGLKAIEASEPSVSLRTSMRSQCSWKARRVIAGKGSPPACSPRFPTRAAWDEPCVRRSASACSRKRVTEALCSQAGFCGPSNAPPSQGRLQTSRKNT